MVGYYTDEVGPGLPPENFIEAKYNFTQRMLDWGGVSGMENAKILDVGCGIGGTTRYMANLLPNSISRASHYPRSRPKEPRI